MTGDADHLLRVVVADLEAYLRFLLDRLTRIPGATSIKPGFVLMQVCYKTALPLDPVLWALRGSGKTPILAEHSAVFCQDANEIIQTAVIDASNQNLGICRLRGMIIGCY